MSLSEGTTVRVLFHFVGCFIIFSDVIQSLVTDFFLLVHDIIFDVRVKMDMGFFR